MNNSQMNAYLQNSVLSTKNVNQNLINLKTLFGHLDVSLKMHEYDKFKTMILKIVDHTNVEDNSIMIDFIRILDYLYKYCETHPYKDIVSVFDTLRQTVDNL